MTKKNCNHQCPHCCQKNCQQKEEKKEPTLTREKTRELLAEGRKIRKEIEQDIAVMRRRRDPQPAFAAIQCMVFNGVAEATDGCVVEPDGHCEHGCPSWLLELGYI